MAIAMTVLDRLVRVPAPTNTSHCEAAAALSETPGREFSRHLEVELPEALHGRVVPAVALAAHRGRDPLSGRG
jgi:hypothetical protein